MTYDDTEIGGPDDRFPATRKSAVVRARSEDPDERRLAFQAIIDAYWKPIYKYLRIRWRRSNEDAKDLTQEFFARLIEKGFLDGYDPDRARLRTYLRICLDRLVQNEDRAAGRLKRGGDIEFLSLDFGGAERELALAEPASPDAMDAYFEREWTRSLFARAIEELERACRERDRLTDYRLFERYDLADDAETAPTYAGLAEEFGLTASTVTNRLAAVRRKFRHIVLAKLREMTGSEEEFRAEVRSILGWGSS